MNQLSSFAFKASATNYQSYCETMNLINKIEYKLSFKNFNNLYKIINKYIQRNINYKNIVNFNCEDIIDVFFYYISRIQYYWLNNNSIENPMEFEFDTHFHNSIIGLFKSIYPNPVLHYTYQLSSEFFTNYINSNIFSTIYSIYYQHFTDEYINQIIQSDSLITYNFEFIELMPLINNKSKIQFIFDLFNNDKIYKYYKYPNHTYSDLEEDEEDEQEELEEILDELNRKLLLLDSDINYEIEESELKYNIVKVVY